MELAIDFGASNTDVVIFKNKKPFEYKTFKPGTTINKIENSFSYKFKKIIVTGGKSSSIADNKKIVHIGEIHAIASGGSYLSKLNKAVVVSCGTGTCITIFNEGKIKHLTGTGVGGGTIIGLSKLTTKISNINQIIKLSQRSKISQDLSIGDIKGKGMGYLKAEMTASNFGCIRSNKKEDTIASIVKMVAETILMLAISSSQKNNNIVMVGRVSKMPKFQQIVDSLHMLSPSKNFYFPHNAEYATAIGAYLVYNSKA